jgi:hypothetical protein
MNAIDTLETTDEVTRLVRTVERLAVADQERILRIVSLLSVAPAGVQRRTQQMLKDLLDSEPNTVHECVTGVDEVIEYLEDNTVPDEEPLGPPGRLELVSWSRRRN